MKAKFPLFSEVVLLQDLPMYNLKRGETATVVEHYPMSSSQEDGYSLEGFSVPNVTVEVSASQITSLQKWQKEMEILKKLDQLSVETLIDLEAYIEELLTQAVNDQVQAS